jgi:hypothetical protein
VIKIKVKELIGKRAVRTGPTESGDFSHTTEHIIILNVTDTHIAYKYTEESMFNSERIHLLAKEWQDGKWTGYDEIVEEKPPPDINIEEILKQLGFKKEKQREYWTHSEISSDIKFDFSYASIIDILLFICREGMEKGLVDGRKQKEEQIKTVLNIGSDD